MDDEWAYVKMAQVFARTGHISYNGWPAAMLGWQLHLGAAFIKLFGFSFTNVRLSILPIGMMTAFLLQRSYVRMGLNEWNATVATAIFVTSPLYLPIVFTYMSDVPGISCIVLCLYICLRAVQSSNDTKAAVWISLAALLNALGGTSRQIAWIGVLVMVPSTLWLLRRRRIPFFAGMISFIAGVCFVFAALSWLHRQPYALPEPFLPASFGLRSMHNLGTAGLLGGGALFLLLLPLASLFIAAVRPLNRKTIAFLGAGCTFFCLLGIALSHWGGIDRWLAPFYGNYMTERAFFAISHHGIRVLITAVTCIGFLSVLRFLTIREQRQWLLHGLGQAGAGWNLVVILVPFSIAYLCLLLPRCMNAEVADRDLLLPLLLALFFLTFVYQERVRTYLPITCLALFALFAAFSIVATHDQFSMYRGYVSAVDELQSAGVPATAIMGPWEFNGWTQLEQTGFVNNSFIRVPAGAYSPQPPRNLPANCDSGFLDSTPAVHPVYGLSFNPHACMGPSQFPPVAFHTWLAPHETFIYVVNYPAASRK